MPERLAPQHEVEVLGAVRGREGDHDRREVLGLAGPAPADHDNVRPVGLKVDRHRPRLAEADDGLQPATTVRPPARDIGRPGVGEAEQLGMADARR